jgi:hypothetical protein
LEIAYLGFIRQSGISLRYIFDLLSVIWNFFEIKDSLFGIFSSLTEQSGLFCPDRDEADKAEDFSWSFSRPVRHYNLFSFTVFSSKTSLLYACCMLVVPLLNIH